MLAILHRISIDIPFKRQNLHHFIVECRIADPIVKVSEVENVLMRIAFFLLISCLQTCFTYQKKANTMREKPEGSSWWLIVDECCRENLTNVGKMKIWYFEFCAVKRWNGSHAYNLYWGQREIALRAGRDMSQARFGSSRLVRFESIDYQPTKLSCKTIENRNSHNTMQQRYFRASFHRHFTRQLYFKSSPFVI